MHKPLFHGFNKVHKKYLLKSCTFVSLRSNVYIKGDDMSPSPCNTRSYLGDM